MCGAAISQIAWSGISDPGLVPLPKFRALALWLPGSSALCLQTYHPQGVLFSRGWCYHLEVLIFLDLVLSNPIGVIISCAVQIPQLLRERH